MEFIRLRPGGHRAGQGRFACKRDEFDITHVLIGREALQRHDADGVQAVELDDFRFLVTLILTIGRTLPVHIQRLGIKDVRFRVEGGTAGTLPGRKRNLNKTETRVIRADAESNPGLGIEALIHETLLLMPRIRA